MRDKEQAGKQEPSVSLTLDEEDIAQRADRKRIAPSKSAATPVATGGGNSGMLVLLSLAVVLLGAGAYYLYDQLVFSQQQLAVSQDRLAALEERLSIAGENQEENSLTMQVRLKELDSEVRKLWDNVWKKQKEQLGEHDAALTAQKKDIDALQKTLNAQSGQAKKLEKLLNDELAQVRRDREEFVSMAGKIDKASSQSEINRKGLVDLNKQVASGGSVGERVAELEKQLAQTEQWLDSVNAFRRQVNRDIESLRQTMTQYHAGSPPP